MKVMRTVKCWYGIDELYPFYQLEKEWVGHEDEDNPEVPRELLDIIYDAMYRFWIAQDMIAEIIGAKDGPHQRRRPHEKASLERMEQMIVEYKEKTI